MQRNLNIEDLFINNDSVRGIFFSSGDVKCVDSCFSSFNEFLSFVRHIYGNSISSLLSKHFEKLDYYKTACCAVAEMSVDFGDVPFVFVMVFSW